MKTALSTAHRAIGILLLMALARCAPSSSDARAPDGGSGAVADASRGPTPEGSTEISDGSGAPEIKPPDIDATAPTMDAGPQGTDTGSPDGNPPAADGQAPVGDAGSGWSTVPAILSRIVEPTFQNFDCDITHYGGVGDGVTDNTAAFAAAITDCVRGGGGRVVVPAGTFFTGPIELQSNINLYVASGATIKFTTDPAKYLPVVLVSWEGSLAYNYRPLISAHDATNIAITGPGTIDGNATMANWYSWRTLELPDQAMIRMQNAMGVLPAQRIYGTGHYLRPSLIELMHCTNVLFDGFTAQNSPFWTIHPVFSKNITARNFHSIAPVPNTDGFDPESCVDVLVQGATIAVGDDALAIKAGRDRDGWTYYTPSENIVVQHCALVSHVGAITIGSEMSAGVRNVYVENSTFSSAAGNLQYGFFIKSAVTRGGFISDIYARQITVASVSQYFFFLTGHYVSGAVVGSTAFTSFSNINVDGVTVSQSMLSPFFIAGPDATKLATGIHFSNVTVAASPAPALATGSGHYADLTTTNVVVNGAPFNPPSTAP